MSLKEDLILGFSQFSPSLMTEGDQAMRRPLFPITLWAWQRDTLHLLNYFSSLAEALLYAKKLPFTPLVLSTGIDLPFDETRLSANEFGEVPGY
jgi:hypothetical protein